MKPGLVLHSIRGNDTILADRVDYNIKSICEYINGGLNSAALSPSLRLPANAFQEGESVYTLSIGGVQLTAGPGMQPVGIIQQNSRLIGASATICTTNYLSTTANYDRIVTVYSGTGPTPTARLQWTLKGTQTKNWTLNTDPAAPYPFTITTGYTVTDTQFTAMYPAGTLFVVGSPLISPEVSFYIWCTLTFATQHSS